MQRRVIRRRPNDRKQQRTRQHQRDQQVLTALYQISLACRGDPSFQQVFETIRHELANVFTFDAAYIALCASNSGNFRAALLVDEDLSEFLEHIEYGDLTGQIVTSGQPLFYRDLSADHVACQQSTTFGDHEKLSRAWMGVPLLIDTAAVGVISLQSYRVGIYKQSDLDLLQRMANVIAVALQNVALLEHRALLQAALEAQISERTAELAALQNISDGLVERQPLTVTLERALHEVLRLFQLDAGNVRLLDEQRQQLVLYAQHGFSADYVAQTTYIALTNSPIREVVLSGQSRITPHGWRQYHANSELPLEIFPPFESSLIMPLTFSGRVTGTLSLFGLAPRPFDEDEVHLAQGVAYQIAILIENSRLLDERERQIEELGAIGRIGQIVTASYDLDQMLAAIYQVFVDLTDATIFALIICDPESGAITNMAFVDEGEWFSLDLVGRKIQPNSLTGWIVQQREPLLFDDITTQVSELQRRGIEPSVVGRTTPPRSWVGVPIVAPDGEIMGVLMLQDYRPQRFDSGTIDFLGQVASHISMGVQKVRLFAERERLLVEARTHAQAAELQAHRIALVHRITTLLASSLDLDEILDLAAKELVQLFEVDHSGTVIIESEEYGYVAAEYPLTGVIGLPLDMRDNVIVKHLNATRRPVIISGFDQHPLAVQAGDVWRAMGITSLVIIPLVSRDRIFGTISLDSYRGVLDFSADELELMMTIATSVAVALENARLFAAEQAQHHTAERLREMARVLSSSFDPAEVLRLVLEELGRVINFDTASIMLLEGKTLRMVATKGYQDAHHAQTLSLPLDGSAAGEVARRRQSLLYVRGEQDLPWMNFASSASIATWLGVPLVARGRVVGVLNIDVRMPPPRDDDAILPPPRRFSQRDLEVAGSFANHAALAIENARLYQESVTRVEQELEIARNIQTNLFPRHLPNRPGIRIAARCIPARETGGDFYDVVELGQHIGIIVGDVSGKSIPAAMLMAAARSITRSEARNHTIPWVTLSETNRWLVDDVPRNSFVALNYALVDLQQQRITLASAGQLSPLLHRADGSISFLDSPPAIPLGINPSTEYCQIEVMLAPNDTILFYTDGIIEAHNQQRELFGFERIEQALQRWGNLEPNDLIEQLLAEVHAFSAGMPPHDDMTIVVMRMGP
ncbi:GAF domain-containing protein [Candidatus Viridilinea mediisalina]|uniref:Stage II sporulation protein E n=1 Tax=Candidatus Viridilinea mediisalina TaxID=2024553 RepID=A0A2A6RDI7_9CHLR|nr:GAF domain-containing protein [Candidatus Viridilinea mediisalina]PDW00421.1 hypothetical protein CJ255_20670 [Candidatus Viridilinea mediisalina]